MPVQALTANSSTEEYRVSNASNVDRQRINQTVASQSHMHANDEEAKNKSTQETGKNIFISNMNISINLNIKINMPGEKEPLSSTSSKPKDTLAGENEFTRP